MQARRLPIAFGMLTTISKWTILLNTLLALTIGASGICRAQGVEHPVVEFDTDIRSRVAGVGKSRTALYDGSARITAGLAPGLHLELNGGHRYGNFLAQQATLEKQWDANRVQVGLVRLPFGIYDTRETYASGLIDYPLPRVDYANNSVNWGAPGMAWSGGSPKAQFEAAYFNGKASGVWGNANAVGGVSARVQTYVNGIILGASHWSGYSGDPAQRQDVHLSGLDWRFTLPHLLVRGEYLFGSYGNNNTQGAYLDVYYHLPKYQKYTLVGRIEALKPGHDFPTGKQVTLGVRYAVTPQWTLALNWRRNNGSQFYASSWTPYAGRTGDFLFQAYHKTHF